MEGIYILFSDNLRNLGHTFIKGVTKLESQNKVLLFGEWITEEQECSLGDLRSLLALPPNSSLHTVLPLALSAWSSAYSLRCFELGGIEFYQNPQNINISIVNGTQQENPLSRELLESGQASSKRTHCKISRPRLVASENRAVTRIS